MAVQYKNIMKSETSVKLTLNIMKERLDKQINSYSVANQPPVDYNQLKQMSDDIQYTRGWVDCLEKILND